MKNEPTNKDSVPPTWKLYSRLADELKKNIFSILYSLTNFLSICGLSNFKGLKSTGWKKKTE